MSSDKSKKGSDSVEQKAPSVAPPILPAQKGEGKPAPEETPAPAENEPTYEPRERRAQE